VAGPSVLTTDLPVSVTAAAGAGLSDAVVVHTLLMRPEDADDLAEVFDEFFPGVRPPRCVSK